MAKVEKRVIMKYTELKISKIEDGISSEIIIAFLAEIGYESFSETDDGVKAYIETDKFDEDKLKEILSNISFEYSFSKIKDQNWNAVWESNFQSVVIAGKCIVRAPFHKPDKKYEMERSRAGRIQENISTHISKYQKTDRND